MKKLTIALLAASISCAASAGEKDPFVWNFATIDQIRSGDAAKGEVVAKKQKCAKCHGDTGIAEDDETPSLAGQVASYTYKQLVDYKVKERDERTMYKRAKKLSRQDMADLAAFYAMQEPEPRASLKQSRLAVPQLVTQGDLSRYLLPCGVCHGENGEGYGWEGPAISGQKHTHFIDTMTEYREGERANDHYARMRFVAGQLTEEEIVELADYYAAKKAPEEE